MSGYVREIKVELTFEGRPVRLVLKPLTRGDMFQLQALMPEQRKKDAPTNPADAVKAGEAFGFYAGRLPEYVAACSGVLDADGQEVPVAEWSQAAYFVQLVGDVMQEHMAKAVPSNPL